MRRAVLSLVLLFVVATVVVVSQETELDAVTQQANQLETQLSKAQSTTPEAAEVMLKLIDLYHEHGRVFGLIRVGQSFVALHSTHARHKDAMLKLLDGLRVTGRNKELIAAGRQFLVRYPSDPACDGVEKTLARMLERARETAGAAAMYEAVWKRNSGTAEGREAGQKAVKLYYAMQNAEGFTKGATLADEMLEKLPPGELASWAGWNAVENWERVSNWQKAAQSGSKTLAKSPPAIPYYLQALAAKTGENYARLTQRTNAVEFFTKALAVPGLLPRPDLHGRLITESYHSGAKPAVLEPLVNEYLQKYPDRDDRHQQRTLLAISYLNDKQPAKAEQILAEVLPFDSRSHGPIGYYFQSIAADPAKVAAAEQVLLNAIAKSVKPSNTQPLRYHLAIDLYRDRLKDAVKARAAARAGVFDHPNNEGYASTMLNWLLDSTASDAEFEGDVTRYLTVRKTVPYWTNYREALAGWIKGQENRKEKEIVARVTFARTQLAFADKNEAFTPWRGLEKALQQNQVGQVLKLRAAILEADGGKSLPDELASDLFYQQQHYYRHYVGAPQNLQSVEWCKRWTERLPKSEYAAWHYLTTTTDLASTKDYASAARHYLTFELSSRNSDAYRRVALCAAGAKDVELGKQAYAWIVKQIQKHGYDGSQATSTGDYLEQLGLKTEALDIWQRGLVADRNNSDSRQCFDRILARTTEDADKVKLLDEQLSHDGYWQFNYAMLKADRHFKAGDLASFEKLLRENAERARGRAFRGWNPENDWPIAANWVTAARNDMKMSEADKRRVFTLIRDLRIFRPTASAAAALLELSDEQKLPPMQRLLALNDATLLSYGDHADWDILMTYAQAAMTRKDYTTASALLGGMLANHPVIDEGRRKPGRDLITQAYSRMGAAGAAIDDKSPIAPLLQAAMHLRLGDSRLAFETYLANQKLFDDHRHEVPLDLLVFVCESHMAAGGDENANRVEDVCRSWIIKNGDAKEIDDTDKARVQLLLGRNYFKVRRYDLARAEFNTVVNRYAKTPQAVEAEFGIGETFMEQKVFDQAEQVFDRLAGNRERDVVIRAEFLRGVLAHRRGDRDEARDIFRRVLERVPSAELANQVLYNLSEVYGAEQRYVDQLELLRTVGRLGRTSKRWHSPGETLSIVVQDSDLGVSRGHARIPVRVWTEPGGDEETIYLLSGGAGKGLFRADLETRLGSATKNDRFLQLTGKDIIRCDYPEEFKKEFKDVPLPDAEIRIAGDARLDFASQKILDEEDEGFSQRLQREAEGDEEKRKSVGRPKNQVKPGNLLYLRVLDPDRDVSDKPDTIAVKLTATSGDQVAATLTETGPHTGVFEGTAKTGELPAAALATNTAIDHSPLMAIDKDPKTFWLSEPDGASPKILTVDMKDLKKVDHVVVSSPDATKNHPVRATLEGSDDGRLWFKLATNPPEPPALPLAGDYGRMTYRIYEGLNTVSYTTWNQVVELSKTGKPTATGDADTLGWTRPMGEKPVPMTALWQGKLVQPRTGAARLLVRAQTSAILLDGNLVLPVGAGERFVDVWLEKGSHDLAVFAAIGPQAPTMEALIFRADNRVTQLLPVPFRESDFDLNQPEAKPAEVRKPGSVTVKETDWDFQLPPTEVRYVRLVIHEYRGEAVAINHMVLEDTAAGKVHLPTDADLLSLAGNDILEIAGGDVITASYIDDTNSTGASRLLESKLTATYHNAHITTIGYDFERQPNGQVANLRKELLRIEPGERLIIEVTDYDQDRTAEPDQIKVFARVNDGTPLELVAVETQENSGVFTKEVDTTAGDEPGKLKIKPGDRIFCWYVDEQNTLPGHAVRRETVVFANEPTEGRLRIVETRAVMPKEERAAPQLRYLPHDKEKKTAGVAFLAPFTVEVIDRDAAKDSRSKVVVQLTTTDGAKVDVECVLDDRRLDTPGTPRPRSALEDGRFTGQVVLQLGGKDSPAVIPLTADMPRNLIGGPKVPKEEGDETTRQLVTHVLNLTGKDVVTATYVEEKHPKEPGTKLNAEARLITTGRLVCTDSEYQNDVTAVHVGERLFLKVIDADLDRSGERDTARVVIRSKRGEEEVVELIETLAHTGVFTGSVVLRPSETPTPRNLKPDHPEVECFFGDVLEVIYVDELSGTAEGPVESKIEVKVVIGTDGKLAAFSKRFDNEELAVETQFHIAESHFELYKSHKALAREAEAKDDLEAGRKILREVMEDYPNPKYAPRVAYLLGQFAQEQAGYLKADEEKAQRSALFKEALEAYQLIVKVYPDHSLAPDAQYKLAQCYEEMQEFNQALDAYVALAATYPQNPLIANVMLRISEHFYKEENYKVAASVGEKFLERFEGHKWGPKMAFRVGQCYYKDKQYTKAGETFENFGKKFSGDPLAADAMFWAGESYRSGNNLRKAFACYNKCRWDHQASEAAKYARGRLALPEMLRLFEEEANLENK